MFTGKSTTFFIQSIMTKPEEGDIAMKELRQKIEDNYLTFITVAAGGVALIAIVIWAITVFVKKVKNK